MDEHPVIALVLSKLPDPAGSFTILAELAAKPGQGGKVASAIAATGAVRLTRAEAGCLAYDLSQDSESPDRFVAYETWRDIAALRAHLATAHFAAVGAAIGDLLAGAPTIRVLTPIR